MMRIPGGRGLLARLYISLYNYSLNHSFTNSWT